LVATALLALYSLRGQPSPRRAAAVSLLVALGIGAPIAARVSGLAECLSMIGLIAGYDAAEFVVGTGAAFRWEGPAAGIATVGAGSLAVAALANPPFTLVTTGVLALIVCVAGPSGPALSRWITPERDDSEDEDDEAGATVVTPAVRRLSTFVAAGPALLVLLAVVKL
jgi:hypothetical protein